MLLLTSPYLLPKHVNFSAAKHFLIFFFISRRVFHPGSLSLKAIICDPVSSIEESIRHLRDESSCVVVGIEQFSGLLRVVKLSKRWSRILPDVCAVLPDRQDVSVVGLTGQRFRYVTPSAKALFPFL